MGLNMGGKYMFFFEYRQIDPYDIM